MVRSLSSIWLKSVTQSRMDVIIVNRKEDRLLNREKDGNVKNRGSSYKMD